MKKWVRKWNLFVASGAFIRELASEGNATYKNVSEKS
jgi:hypothetical protein